MKTFLNFTMIFLGIMHIAVYGQNIETSNKIKFFLKDSLNVANLNYPKSVIRCYAANSYSFLWLNDKQKINQTEVALALLVQANRFGLLSSDYYPKNLTFERLNKLRSFSSEKHEEEKAMFDILMTDGLIAFINNNHFGKYNPLYNRSYIDSISINGFCADKVLSDARRQVDFFKAVCVVQPKLKAYQELHNYLNQSFTRGNSDTASAELAKILINMERLRWINTQSSDYVWINIPSYTLAFHNRGNVSEFKVVVGKPKTATPVLESEIDYFSTAPDWRVPQSIFQNEILPEILENSAYLEDNHYSIYNETGGKVIVNSSTLKEINKNPRKYSVRQSSGDHNALGAIVFRFQNADGVYLHDTPQKQYFKRENRALSHGCIRVQNPKLLATQLLEFDNSNEKIPVFEEAVNTYSKRDFILKKPIPIIITYLTVLIKNGKPVIYNDIYQLDKSLIARFNHDMRTAIAP